MVHRICNPLLSNSFFVFGARGTGKTTLLLDHLKNQRTLHFDFLKPEIEEQYSRDPQRFKEEILAQYQTIDWVVLDEIQRVPKLLNTVHSLIESHQIRFAMTGSSARKLKRGQANLLAGRAFLNDLHPLTHLEYGGKFNLEIALNWGGLPKLLSFENDVDRSEYLKSYVITYVQEEIKAEQLVKNLDPFRRFLEVAAQSNAKIINYTNIHRDVGVDVKTVQNYYSILEDTLLGFFLEPYHSSVRKALSQKPKFYFFDLGVQKALARQLNGYTAAGTSYFGELFESFFILECRRLNDYYRKDFQFYFLKTRDDHEIDLIIKRPGKSLVLIEIKSAEVVREDHLKNFIKLSRDFPDALKICACRETEARKIQDIRVMPWMQAITKIFE